MISKLYALLQIGPLSRLRTQRSGALPAKPVAT